MNILRITLRDDGDLESQKRFGIENVYQDFVITRGGYRNVLISIDVPITLLSYRVKDEDNITAITNGNNVKIGGILQTVTGRNLTTKSYEFTRINTLKRDGVEYAVYQRVMPKEFTMWDVEPGEVGREGEIKLTINIINWISDGKVKVEEVNTSPCFPIYIQPGEYLTDEDLPNPSDFDILYSQVQELNKEFTELDANKVPINAIKDINSSNVQGALEELSKRTDSQQVDTIEGVDEGLVDNTDPRNPIINHDSTKTDNTDFNAAVSSLNAMIVNEHERAQEAETANADGIADLDNKLKSYALTSNTGASLDLNIDTSTYVMSLNLKNFAGEVLSSNTIDFPLESMVVNATYSSGTLTLVLQNGNKLSIDISSIISGLVNSVDFKNLENDVVKLANELTNETSARINSDNMLQAQVEKKVDKVNGKQLSTNDYTTAEKEKLLGIEVGAQVNVVPDWNDIINKPHIPDGVILYNETGSATDGSMTQKIVTEELLNKVDKVAGKELSTNDYTALDKEKLAGVETGANKTIVDSQLSSTSTNPVQNTVVTSALGLKSNLIYSRIIKTQDEFNVWCEEIKNGSFIGKSVLLDGSNGEFICLNGGILIPETLYLLEGINNARIKVLNASKGLYYSSKPTSNQYAIKNIILSCTNADSMTSEGSSVNTVYGFFNCPNIENCQANVKSTYITGDNADSYAFGYYNCDYLTNCSADCFAGAGAYGIGYAYGYCDCVSLKSCIAECDSVIGVECSGDLKKNQIKFKNCDGSWEIDKSLDQLTSQNVKQVQIDYDFDFYNYDYKIIAGFKCYDTNAAQHWNESSIRLSLKTESDAQKTIYNNWCRFTVNRNEYNTSNQFDMKGWSVSGSKNYLVYGVDGNDGSGNILFNCEIIPVNFEIEQRLSLAFKCIVSRESTWCQQQYQYSGQAVDDSSNFSDVNGITFTETSTNVVILNNGCYLKIYKRPGGYHKSNQA